MTEQDREDSELVKIDGKWLIKRRYISSDSGLPDRFDKTFKQRNNPLEWDKIGDTPRYRSHRTDRGSAIMETVPAV